MLTAMSSAMIYGLLPVFMVRVLGISIASVGSCWRFHSLAKPAQHHKGISELTALVKPRDMCTTAT